MTRHGDHWLEHAEREARGLRVAEIQGTVQIGYPRRWWQWRRRGWYPHVDGFGVRCWIRFNWNEDA